MARFDPKSIADNVKSRKTFEHETLGAIEYVMPTVDELAVCMKKEDNEQSVKDLLFIMLSPCNPTLMMEDIGKFDPVTFKALSEFVMKVLDFRVETKN